MWVIQGGNMKGEKTVYWFKTAIAQVGGFIKRPKRNYRVAITRAATSSFLLNLTLQYDSIYTVALGANKIQLGSISSIGTGVSSLISTPVGWLVDRYGLKIFYLLGIGLQALGMLIYATAFSWKAIIVAMILTSISMRLIGTGCSVICADSLNNEDRATGQNFCVTLSRLSALISPMIAAFLVTAFGGMNVEGIRPLYYIQFVGYFLIFLLVAAKLREPERIKISEEGGKKSFISDFRRLFEHSTALRRWIVVASLGQLPMALTTPFLQVFAKEVKGADQFVLGEMATAGIALYLLFGIPMGRLADRIGRKKVIYLTTPLWYASNLLLIFAPNFKTLVVAGALQSFYSISSVAASSMTLELVPVGQMGRWSGLLGFLGGLVAVPAPLIGGLIWNKVGPAYVFLIPVAVDLFLRIPLLTTIPETLEGSNHGGGNFS
jgi:DHA1 family multidrug resistance protein-like MFS transporter